MRKTISGVMRVAVQSISLADCGSKMSPMTCRPLRRAIAKFADAATAIAAIANTLPNATPKMNPAATDTMNSGKKGESVLIRNRIASSTAAHAR